MKWSARNRRCFIQRIVLASVVDPDPDFIGSVDSDRDSESGSGTGVWNPVLDPDPGGQKLPIKIKKFHV